MGVVRILNNTAKVESQSTANDVVYTVSGEGAANLHKICQNYLCNPSALVDGQFTVSKVDMSDYTSLADTPTVTAIRDGLASAAPTLQRQ